MPFFIRFPGQEEGEVNDTVGSTIDLVPTIVGALGIETDWTFDGQSLVDTVHRTQRLPAGLSDLEMSPELDGLLRAAPPGPPLVAGTTGWASPPWEPTARWSSTTWTSWQCTPAGVWQSDQLAELEAIDAGSGELPVRIQGTVSLGPGQEPPGRC